MRPANLRTRLFLDGGNQAETKEIKEKLGFLDGQTTNPSLIVHHPEAAAKLASGEKLTGDELLIFYRHIVSDIAVLLPDGSVSIEVYADDRTTTEQMIVQAREMNTWIPNAHIKFPTTFAGLGAAELAIAEGMRVNLTLCFSQEQAAAVYAATRGAKRGDVFVSPFVGRLDDRGENGMQLIENIQKMFAAGDGHVEVLTASVRGLPHLEDALAVKSDIITTPGKVLAAWAEAGRPVPETFDYDARGLSPMPYQEVALDRPWQDYDLDHELTASGIARFAADWNSLLG